MADLQAVAGGARALRALGLIGLAALGIAAFTPLPSALNAWMAGPPRLEPAQAIVVLARGGVDTDEVLSNASLRRTLFGVTLYRKGLAPLLVFSGGDGGDGRGEAAVRAELARGWGVPPGAVLTAPPVRNTREEAVAVRRLLGARGIDRILLVADPVDMPRTRAAFERVGFSVLPAPTVASGPFDPASRLHLVRDILIELMGLAYYRLAGYL